MNKVINDKKYKIKEINKLILFNFAQLLNSVIFWLLLLLSLISQPIIILVIYFIDSLNLLSYSLLIILIPLILIFIHIVFQISVLFQDNKTNSIEYKIICSRYSKLKITISRMITIFITILPTILMQDLFLFFLLFVNMNKLYIALFISNTFISPFIYLFLLSFLVLISLKINKVPYIIISIIFGIISLGSSLIVRTLTMKNNESFNYNDSSSMYSYIRLVNNKDDLLFVDFKNNDSFPYPWMESSVIKQINNSNYLNSFIPSEWLMSFYSSLFSDLNFNITYNSTAFNLLSMKVISNNNNNNLLNYYSIRPIDIDFSKLSNFEYFNLISNEIDNIIEKYELDKSVYTSRVYEIISSEQNWNNIPLKYPNFASLIMNLLIDTTGVNTEFNQLFYLIKYKDTLINKIPNIFINIKEKYNEDIYKLFKFILTSDTTISNVINSENAIDGIFNTKKNINEIYPMIDSISFTELPIEENINFIKNNLLKFITDENGQTILTYLNNQNIYSLENCLEKFNSYYPEITNFNSWSNYLDSLKTYNDFQELLNNIQNKIFPDIYEYSLSKNSIDTYNAVGFLKLKYHNQTSFSQIFIILYIMLLVLIIFLIYKTNKFHSWKVKKNDKK